MGEEELQQQQPATNQQVQQPANNTQQQTTYPARNEYRVRQNSDGTVDWLNNVSASHLNDQQRQWVQNQNREIPDYIPQIYRYIDYNKILANKLAEKFPEFKEVYDNAPEDYNERRAYAERIATDPKYKNVFIARDHLNDEHWLSDEDYASYNTIRNGLSDHIQGEFGTDGTGTESNAYGVRSALLNPNAVSYFRSKAYNAKFKYSRNPDGSLNKELDSVDLNPLDHGAFNHLYPTLRNGVENGTDADVEVEGNEIVLRRNEDGSYSTSDDFKGAPTHEQGGEDYHLSEGDIVFPAKQREIVKHLLANKDYSGIDKLKKSLPDSIPATNKLAEGVDNEEEEKKKGEPEKSTTTVSASTTSTKTTDPAHKENIQKYNDDYDAAVKTARDNAVQRESNIVKPEPLEPYKSIFGDQYWQERRDRENKEYERNRKAEKRKQLSGALADTFRVVADGIAAHKGFNVYANPYAGQAIDSSVKNLQSLDSSHSAKLLGLDNMEMQYKDNVYNKRFQQQQQEQARQEANNYKDQARSDQQKQQDISLAQSDWQRKVAEEQMLMNDENSDATRKMYEKVYANKGTDYKRKEEYDKNLYNLKREYDDWVTKNDILLEKAKQDIKEGKKPSEDPVYVENIARKIMTDEQSMALISKKDRTPEEDAELMKHLMSSGGVQDEAISKQMEKDGDLLRVVTNKIAELSGTQSLDPQSTQPKADITGSVITGNNAFRLPEEEEPDNYVEAPDEPDNYVEDSDSTAVGTPPVQSTDTLTNQVPGTTPTKEQQSISQDYTPQEVNTLGAYSKLSAKDADEELKHIPEYSNAKCGRKERAQRFVLETARLRNRQKGWLESGVKGDGLDSGQVEEYVSVLRNYLSASGLMDAVKEKAKRFPEWYEKNGKSTRWYNDRVGSGATKLKNEDALHAFLFTQADNILSGNVSIDKVIQ